MYQGYVDVTYVRANGILVRSKVRGRQKSDLLSDWFKRISDAGKS